MRCLCLVAMLACNDQANAVTIPPTSASSTPKPVVAGSASPSPSAASAPEVVVAFDVASHFKGGGRGRIGDMTFTVRMLPKLIQKVVATGEVVEIEQVQLDVVRGNDRSMVQLDTRHKRAEWSGIIFDFGHADVYNDDIELTLHKK